MTYKHTFAVAALTLASSMASAALVFQPTNEDTDFLQLDFSGVPGSGSGITTNGGTLAIFDNNDPGLTNPLEIGEDGGHVVFTDNMDGTWNAEVFDVNNSSGGSLTLTDNPYFRLGIDWGAGYFSETAATKVSAPDAWLISFDGLNAQEGQVAGNTIGVDLKPIPVPAAVWLFGTGLLGLVGIARRRA